MPSIYQLAPEEAFPPTASRSVQEWGWIWHGRLLNATVDFLHRLCIMEEVLWSFEELYGLKDLGMTRSWGQLEELIEALRRVSQWIAE